MSVFRCFFIYMLLMSVCLVQATEQTSLASKIKQDLKRKTSEQKKKKTSRKISSKGFRLLSKKEIFRDDTFEETDASKDINQANEVLSSLEKVCELKNVKRKVRYLNKRFNFLTKLSNKYLEGQIYVSPDDKLFFLITRDLVDIKNINYGRPVTARDIPDTDLRVGFKMYYFSQNNLPFATDVDDFPDIQAQQIYKGIECLY